MYIYFDYLIFGVDISTVHFSSNDCLVCSTQSYSLPKHCVNSFVDLYFSF